MWLAYLVSAAERRIYRPENPGRACASGVFIGIHGECWVGNAIASIDGQDIERTEVVAAVNGNFPDAVRQLRQWQATSRHRVTVVQNSRNLGPLGSWHLNQDLLTAPWSALMHQDDHYLPHHLTTLLGAAESAPDDVLAVFGSMAGMDEVGREVAAPPMDNQHLDMASTAVTLPAILRRHPFPTPAVMMRHPAGYVDDLAWYDSGAPDSEWFARLACRGRFRVLDTVTMRYRLSPGSESQSTGWGSRAWQWAQSVERVIHSDDFGRALAAVPPAARASFAADVLDAIPSRYPASPIFGFLAFTAAQRMATSWHYEPGPATDLLATYLAADPGSAATRNLAGITGVPSPHPSHLADDTVRLLLGDPPTRGRLEESGRAAYRRFGHLLPPPARVRAYRLYDRLWAGRGAR